MTFKVWVRCIPWVMALLVAEGAALAEAPVYDIVLSRPCRVGDRFAFEANGQSKQTSSLPGKKEPKVETLSVVVSGELEVLEVREGGQVKRSRLTVKAFDGKADGARVGGIAPGDTITIAVEEGKTVYLYKGAPFDGALLKLFKLVIQYRGDDGPDDQAYFGTDVPQPVGGTWPVNAALAAAAMTRDKMTVEPSDVTGASRLTGVTMVDEVACLQVQGKMDITDVDVELPRMAQLTSSAFSVEMEGDFPVDPALPPMRVATTVDLDVKLKGTGLLSAFRFGTHDARTAEQRLRVIERGPAPEAPVEVKPKPEPADVPAGGPPAGASGWRVLRSE